METVYERIENLSDEMLNVFVEGVARINCGGFDKLTCTDCPLQIDGACLCVKLYEERDRRKAKEHAKEETVATSTTELEAKAQELVKQLDLLVELLNKF